MTQQIIKESASLTLALGIGIYAYSYMSKYIRTLFFQLVTWIAFYLSSYALTYFQDLNGITKNNSMIFNIGVPTEFFILTIAVYYSFKDKYIKYLILSSYVLFLTIVCLQIRFSEDKGFLNYAMASGSIIMTILFIMVIYQQLKLNPRSWQSSPEIWSSLGLIIYFACNVPYISSMTYLNENFPNMSTSLFHVITDNLANIRYILLALAFWMAWKNRTILNGNAT